MKKMFGVIATLGIAALCTGVVLTGGFSPAHAGGSSTKSGSGNSRNQTKQQALAGGAAAPAAAPAVSGIALKTTTPVATSGLSEAGDRVIHGSLGSTAEEFAEFFQQRSRRVEDDLATFPDFGTDPFRGPGCGPLTLTQNTDPNTVVGGGVACAGGGITAENAFARCFNLATGITAGQQVTINCVDFGVEANNPAFTVNVNIYTVTACPPTVANRTLVRSLPVVVPNVGLSIQTATFVPPVIIPANSSIMVEVFAPDRDPAAGGDGGAFFMGSNAAGQSAPSFIKAPDCGITNYTSLAAIGFPNMHILMRVDYSTDVLPDGACCDDIAQSCTDNVNALACISPNRFHANQTCAEINPTCGNQPNTTPCFAELVECGDTIQTNNVGLGFDANLELVTDPASPFTAIVPRSTQWYKFVATHTSARVRTCGTDAEPDAASHTIVSILAPQGASCTSDAECGPGGHCIAECVPSTPGSTCGTANGFCDGCNIANMLEIRTSSKECGDCASHGSACTEGQINLEIGRVYYVMVGSLFGSTRGNISLEIDCPCGDNPSGACCTGEENCFDINQGSGFVFGAVDCFNTPGGGTWQGDGSTCGTTTCEDSPDNCGTPEAIACGGSTTIDNSCFTTAAVDTGFSCFPAGNPPEFPTTQGAGNFWLTFVATDTSARVFTTGADTIIAVYDTSSACSALGGVGGNELGCNDDGGTNGASDLCVDGLTIGNTYVVQVGSFFDVARGSITVNVECPGPCAPEPPCPDLVCPGGAVQEPEACGQELNSGCSADPATEQFTDIECGDTVCGTADTDGATRDTDWYRFELTETSEVTVDLESQFLADAFILLVVDCDNIFIVGDGITATCGTPGSQTATLPPGEWFIFVGPDFAANADCGPPALNTSYVLSLDCTPISAGCCTGAGQCSDTTEDNCAGTWFGLDTEGTPITCADAPTRCDTGACCGPEGCEQAVSEIECEQGAGYVCDVNALVGQTCFADTDANGVVNAADRGQISANIGQTGDDQICRFDLDGNGVINAADRGQVSANIGLCNPLPNYQNGSGLNAAGDGPDTRFGGGGGGPLVPGGEFAGYGVLCEDCPCVIGECTGTAEGEPACTPDYEDTTNGGCFSDPFVAGAVTCGETICGQGGWHDLTEISCTVDADCPGIGAGRCSGGFCNNGPFVGADADWYAFTIPAGPNQEVTWTVDAEFPTAIFLTSAPVDCNAGVTAAFGDCGEAAVISACLPPGTHFAAVLAFGFDGVVGCDRDYTATLTCGTCPTGACCNNGECTGTTDEPTCVNGGGLWVAGETCPAFACPGACNNNGDNCAEACEIEDGSTPFSTIGSTTDGQGHPGTGCEFNGDGGQLENDIWRSYTATCTGVLTLDLCDGDALPGTTDDDSRIAVYDGGVGTCGALSLLGCNDDGAGCANFTSFLEVPVVQGNEYLVRIGGFDATVFHTGTLYIECNAAGDGDACASPVPVSCGSSMTFDNTGFTEEPADPNASCNFNGPTAETFGTKWFTFTGTGQNVQIQTCNTAPTGTADTGISVYTGSCGAFTEVACGEDDCIGGGDQGNGWMSDVCFATTNGTQYFVSLWHAFGGDVGEVTLDVSCGSCTP